MGNATNPKQWAARERLRFIERSAFWRGVVNRSDLQEVFGLSAAQASSDLQQYQQMQSGNLHYNLRAKRYEGSPKMKCGLHRPSLGDAIQSFLGGPGAGGNPLVAGMDFDHANPQVAVLPVLASASNLTIERLAFQAVYTGSRLTVEEISSNGTAEWAAVQPHAFAHDGHRWRMRVWCEFSSQYRDVWLSRVRGAELGGRADHDGSGDDAWNSIVTLTLKPNSKLPAAQQELVAADFGMTQGRLQIEVRDALLDSVLDFLRLPGKSGRTSKALLERVGS